MTRSERSPPRRARPRATPAGTRRNAPLVVAVDVGSSSIRAGLYDAAGRPVRGAFAQVGYRPDVDDHGAVELPVDRLLATLTATIDGLVARAGPRLGRVAAAGISCFLHSVAAQDGEGRVVSPLLTWADTTSADAAEDLRSALDAAAVWQTTGAPLHASYWPAKLVRLRASLGDGAIRFTSAPEIVWHALTGRRGIDLSHASGTGLVDRASGHWHGDLLRHLGVSPGALPPILPPDTAAPLSGWAATRFPALAGIPWYAPWSDALCGNVGLGALSGGPAALQIGTSGAIRVLVADGVPHVPAGLFAQRLANGGSLVGGQLSEGGGVAAAVAGLLGSGPAALERQAVALPPDGHGLTVLPFLAGERGPGYHERARGTISGLGLATSPAEVYLATVESVALRFASVDRRLADHLGGPPCVVASGGAIARSKLLATVIAAALGRTVELSAVGEASARGAAVATLAVTGLIPGVDAVPPPPGRIVEPEPARVAAMQAAAARQEALYQAVLGDG